MISAKPMAVVAMLALASGAVAQEMTAEQRIAELIGQLKGHDYQQAASWELVAIGAPAVQSLIDVLEDETSVSVQIKVITTLGRMRATAVPALPVIVNSLARDGVTNTAWLAVGDIAPYSAEDPFKSGELAQAFWSSRLMRFLKDHQRLRDVTPPRQVRLYVRAVNRLEVDPRSSTDHLVDLLGSDNPYAVAFAAQLLGERSTEAQRVVSHLQRCLEEVLRRKPDRVLVTFEDGPSIEVKDVDWREAYYATAEALARIAPLTPQAIAGHRLRLTRGSNVKLEDLVSSVSALVSMGSSAVEAVPELLAAARARNTPLASDAITALGMIGPSAKDAIPTLERLTEHDNPQIAERAKAALRQIRGS